MMMLGLFLGICWIVVGAINGEAQLEPYYGVPIGEFGDTKVYAADSRTLTIVGKNGRRIDEAKCTSFIGSLLDRRVKRQKLQLRDGNLVPQIQALNPNRHPLDWPFEFGHLRIDEGGESGSQSGSVAGPKIQDPFDVQLSKDDDDTRNGTHSLLPDQKSTITTGITSENSTSATPEPTTAATTPDSTNRSNSTRVRTVTASIPDIDELKTSVSGPRLTLPARKTTTPSTRNDTTVSGPTSTIPTIVLSSIVLHSSVNTGDIAVENVTGTPSPASSVESGSAEHTKSTSSTGEGSSEEPPPIGGANEDPITSFEDTDGNATLTPDRKALWSRPTADSITATTEAELVEGSGEESTSESTENTSSTSSGAATKHKSRKDKERTTTAAKPKPTKEPNSGPGISWGDQPKPDQNTPKQKSSDTAQASASNVIWLGNGGGGSTVQPQSQWHPGQVTFYPPGRPGKNTGRPVSILRQLPVEYFGGLNVPDELEGKNANGTDLLPPQAGQSGRSGQAKGGDPGVLTIQLGGSRKPNVNPVQPETTPQPSFRGLPPSPPSPPSPPAAPSPPVASPSVPPTSITDPNAPKNATERLFADGGGDETDCGGKPWCVVADPHQRRTRPPAPPTTPTSNTPTHPGDTAWYVVDDRHSQVRANADGHASTRIKRQVPAKISSKKPFQKVSKDPALHMPQPVAGTKHGNQVYLVPRFDANKITVRLPEPYQLSDFESIGFYDQCRRVRIANIKSSKVDAPKEALLTGLRGWQYEIGSTQVRILNCNSILIKSFTFSGAGKTDAHFYVGSGAYPFNIVKKIQVNLVGEAQNQSLKNYKNQDILIRLPVGVRTMDITWLAVQTTKGASLAHVIIPPVLVPPCD